MLASGASENRVVLWDVATGKEKAVLGRHANRTACGAFSPDGRRLASGSFAPGVKVWDVDTRTELVTLDTGPGGDGSNCETWEVVFSPDGNTLVTAHNNGSIRVWDTASWTLARALPDQPAR